MSSLKKKCSPDPPITVTTHVFRGILTLSFIEIYFSRVVMFGLK